MDATLRLGEIEVLLQRARAGELETSVALEALAAVAEGRGGVDGRRRDGAYFTAADVSVWLARRAIVCAVTDGLGIDRFDAALADGACDLHAALEVEITALVLSGDRDAPSRALEVLTSLHVLDPTCGGGALLVAAMHELLAIEQLLHRCARAAAIDLRWRSLRVTCAQLHGIDVDAVAIAACRGAIELALAESGAARGARAPIELVVADAVAAPLLESLPRLAAAGGADVIVGNPPFVRAAAQSAPADLQVALAGNLAAWVLERAVAATAPGGRLALVLPISVSCTDQWQPVRSLWHSSMSVAWASHFDAIPSTLFPGVVQRITLLEGRTRAAPGPKAAPCAWHTTTYHRWRSAERDRLLDAVRFVPDVHFAGVGSLPKVGSHLELGLLERLRVQPAAARLLDLGRRGRSRAGEAGTFSYKRRWSYFLLFTDFAPEIWSADGQLREPSELKSIAAATGVDRSALIAIYSSSLFWWYFSVFTDNRNVNVRDLAAFPIPPLDDKRMARLAAMGARLMDSLRASARVRECTYGSVGTIRNTYFRQGSTRPVLDVIDRELAEAYGLQQRELDFILGFERRFRS